MNEPQPERVLASDPVLRELVRRLVDGLQPEEIYLFGSRARGEGDDDSDYDLMVVVAESDDPVHIRARSVRPLLWDVAAPVDVLVWTRREFDRRHRLSLFAAPATCYLRPDGRNAHHHLAGHRLPVLDRPLHRA